MSPTIFRHKGCRFFFFSREEERPHVHVSSGTGEAKLWLQPTVEVAVAHGIAAALLNELVRTTEEHRDDFLRAWHEHFRG